MDPKADFFAKLKKLCGTLETEAALLQQTFDNRHDSGGSEAAAKAIRAFHDLNCDVFGLKGQLQDMLNEQKAHKKGVDAFIQACRAMQSKVAHDVRALTEHFENYGYQAPTDTRAPNAEGEKLEDKESGENKPEEGKGPDEEEEEVALGCSRSPMPPPAAELPNRADPMRTPRMSDFGLCELQLRWNFLRCGQEPTMPDVSFPSLDMPTPLPPTPKCTLRMDDDERPTPQMMDFGISEDTMFFNSDFTMDLFRKNADKRPAQNQDPPVPALTESLSQENSLVSPEPPVFCTPGFEIKKTNGHCSPPPQGVEDDAQFRSSADNPETPEVPVFQTPSLKRLLSSKKHEPLVAESEDSHFIPRLVTPRDCAIQDQRRMWEYDVPELRIPGVQDSLDSDGATQDLRLSTPRIMREFHEMSTPEMPDLSSVTQDICKIVLESQKSQKRVEHKSRFMNVVSKQEFHSLPEFLKVMTLNNLNQAVHNINKYLAQCPGQDMCKCRMEELKMMTDMGIKAPIYMLCLTELKRLEKMEGVGNDSVYKLSLSS
ncbi:spindle and kinetochore-associated protein 3 isoform X1 [Phycodurus eques]|uniref:spindle and kinetochore-associated protein 3 isoform X1 n=1 Tax=Phycodurus eques TaxID=693459 RepID=UPI002ACE0F65|nr:spindle and kinetochore-associated protein 3 isoform X1 [Phycodurus eques]